MTKRQIASLAIKLMGVYILVNGISYISMNYIITFNMFSRYFDGYGLLMKIIAAFFGVVACAVPILCALLLIMSNDKLAKRLIKDDDSIEAAGASMTKDDVMTIAISCIGLYFIVSAIPMVINAMINSTFHMRQQFINPLFSPSRMLNLLKNMSAPAVKIGLGVWLFAGSKGIVKLWKKIRS